MTKPSKKAAAPTASSYLLVAVKILLVVVIILLLPKLVTGASTPGGKRNKKLLQQYEAMRLECARGECKEFLPEESSMCVSNCISTACHQDIYGKNLLEDGEIDVVRGRAFQRCVKDELRTQRRTREAHKKRT